MATTRTKKPDRNEAAVAKKRAESLPKEYHSAKLDLTIPLCAIDLEWIDRVQRSVEYPERPTYEVETVGGRKQNFPIDAAVAKQSPEYAPIWKSYLIELGAARNEQADRVLRATLLDGTVMPHGWDNPAWRRRMRFLGQPIPEDPQEEWVVYLISSLDTDEMMEITRSIYRLSGVPEDLIKEAEASFPDPLSDESAEGGDVADTGSDSEGDSGE